MAFEGSTTPISLFLLPPLAWPVSHETIRETFGSSLDAVLQQLQHEVKRVNTGTKLDIAVPLSYLYENRELPRAMLYGDIQKIIASLYQIICVIAVKNQINVEDAEGIDARILLLAHSRHSATQELCPMLQGYDPVDSIADLKTLACSQRPWQHIFSIDNNDGDQILREFLVYETRRVNIRKIGGGSTIISHNVTARDRSNTRSSQRQVHTSIAVGGTFDHIHFGHKHLLTMFAFLLPSSRASTHRNRDLTIGITGDELLLNKKYRDLLESWNDRQRSVLAFLSGIMDFRAPDRAIMDIKTIEELGPNGHAIHMRLAPDLVIKCVEINDPFGPTITDSNISALVISAETREGGKAVNEKRVEKNWAELEVFEVQVLSADEGLGEEVGDQSFENKLSSTQIRYALREKARARSKV